MNDWALPQNTSWSRTGVNRHPQSRQSFFDTWAERSAIWGTRHGVGESLDRYFGLYAPPVSSSLVSRASELGLDDLEVEETGPLGYHHILKLGNDHISWKEASGKSFWNKVKENVEPLRNQVKHAPLRDFFQDVSTKAYAKETLWQSNIKPFQDLFSGSRQNLCMNLGYTAGVGFAGASILHTGIQHYRYWKRKEDGSIGSQWHTAYETGKALCEKTFQAFGSWEAAGIGMAIGRALIPIGAFPIGGILVGALFATTAYKAIGKIFPSLAKPGLSKS